MSNSTKEAIHVRWMIRRDRNEVLKIESQAFEHPWTDQDFIRCLRQRNCIGMVATAGKDYKVVGFMIYELHKNRVHLINFAVDPAYRRQGVGTAMMDKLKSKLSTDQRNQLTLEVRETNLPAQLFFKKQGLKAISVLRDYWEDSPEDAYIMQYKHRDITEEEDVVSERAPSALSPTQERQKPEGFVAREEEREKERENPPGWPGHGCNNDFY